MQSPQDDWDFYSFEVHATVIHKLMVFESILVHSDSSLFELSYAPRYISSGWGYTDLPMIVIPLMLLQHQVHQTSDRLRILKAKVERVESVVSTDTQTADLSSLVQDLHNCNTELIKLERRWGFQNTIASSIQDLINTYRVPEKMAVSYKDYPPDQRYLHSVYGEGFLNPNLDFEEMESELTRQKQTGDLLKYDISVLPRRISNQFTAVRLLMHHCTFKRY